MKPESNEPVPVWFARDAHIDLTPVVPWVWGAAPWSDDKVPWEARPKSGVYRHYKGGFYTVLGIGRRQLWDGDKQSVVLYQCLRTGLMWLRNLTGHAGWITQVTQDGKTFDRFVPASIPVPPQPGETCGTCGTRRVQEFQELRDNLGNLGPDYSPDVQRLLAAYDALVQP